MVEALKVSEGTNLLCVKCHKGAEYVLHGLSICTDCMEHFKEEVAKSNSPIIKP